MDDYDDLQVEEFSHFDFVEEMNENLADDDDKEDKRTLTLTNYDSKSFTTKLILQQTNDLKT
jgi:hypothetical protein